MKYGQECVATELPVTVQTGITTLGERKETGSLCYSKIYAYLWSFLGAFNNRNVCFKAFEKNIDRSSISNSPKLGTTQISIKNRVSTLIVVIHTVEYYIPTKMTFKISCKNMDEPYK